MKGGCVAAELGGLIQNGERVLPNRSRWADAFLSKGWIDWPKRLPSDILPRVEFTIRISPCLKSNLSSVLEPRRRVVRLTPCLRSEISSLSNPLGRVISSATRTLHRLCESEGCPADEASLGALEKLREDLGGLQWFCEYPERFEPSKSRRRYRRPCQRFMGLLGSIGEHRKQLERVRPQPKQTKRTTALGRRDASGGSAAVDDVARALIGEQQTAPEGWRDKALAGHSEGNLSIEDAAGFIRMSERTIYRMMDDGMPYTQPSGKPNSHRRISKSDLRAWVTGTHPKSSKK